MNASSNDAVIGVSSWTRRPSRAARSPICGAVSPSTVNDPVAVTNAGPRRDERRSERGRDPG